jgi:hypothetical protein
VSIDSGDCGLATEWITGKTNYTSESGSDMAAAFNSRSYVTTGSMGSWPNGQEINADGVVCGHCYAYMGYNKSINRHVLFNPWGIQQSQAPVYVTLTDALFTADFGTGAEVFAARGASGSLAPPISQPGPADAGLAPNNPGSPAPDTARPPAPVYVAGSPVQPGQPTDGTSSHSDRTNLGGPSWESGHVNFGAFVG